MRETSQNRSRSKSPPKGCPKGNCFNFFLHGKCQFQDKCRYRHETCSSSVICEEKKSKPKEKDQSTSSTSTEKKEKNIDKCARCALHHRTDECKFKGTCNFCGKEGHKQIVCRLKEKGGKPNPTIATAPKAKVAFVDETADVKPKKRSWGDDDDDERPIEVLDVQNE